MDATRNLCPRCPASEEGSALAPGFGALHEDVCPRCQGRFLPAPAVERVLVDEHGLSTAVLREMVALFASRERLPCPGCGSKLSPIQVRGVRIDLCTGCGGAWLDAGELTRLGEGRHEELSPAPGPAPEQEPVVETVRADDPGPPTPAPAAAGKVMVFLTSLAPPPLAALQTAFARIPGLTAVDASLLAHRNNGVVLDGVTPQVAEEVVAALVDAGVGAAAADGSWATLPAVLFSSAVEPGPLGLVFGRGDPTSSFEIPWANVLALAAGELKRTSMKRGPLQRTGVMRDAHSLPDDAAEFELVETDDAFFDVIAGSPLRRVRVALSRVLFGEAGRGRDRAALFRERIASIARLVGPRCAIGRGVRACLAGGRLHRYRSARELEREESWLLWKHHGPGAALGE